MKKNTKKKWEKPRVEEIRINKHRGIVLAVCDKETAELCVGLQPDYGEQLVLFT